MSDFARLAETDAVRRILILDKTAQPIPNGGARIAPWGSLSRDGFLAKSNGLRYGGYALKGLSEDLRFYSDRRRLDRRILRHGNRRAPWRVTHLFRLLPTDLGVCQRAYWTDLTIVPARSRRSSLPPGVLRRRDARARKARHSIDRGALR
jgi:hypothetical protein